MDIFSYSLSNSVITTVWLTLFVLVFLNLSLGWGSIALVLAGFMTPFIILMPFHGATLILEGIMTYLLYKLVSQIFMRTKTGAPFFGRDRYFAIILSTICVRLIVDLLLFPGVGHYVEARFNLRFDYHANLQSSGLVMVAVLANLIENQGFVRWLYRFPVVMIISVLLVQFVLVPYTNFSITGLLHFYEAFDLTIESAPKAYFILVTTGLIGWAMASKFGWDYGGFNIAPLLALQWYRPEKIVYTIIQASFIFLVSEFAMRLPFIRNITFEGTSRVLLFFNIGFFYLFVMSSVMDTINPFLELSDYDGVAYLLPTLVALRMSEKNSLLRISGSLVVTSFVGVLIGTALGYIFFAIANYSVMNPKASDSSAFESVTSEILVKPIFSEQSIEAYLRNKYFIDPSFFAQRGSNAYVVPTIDDLKFIDKEILSPLFQILAETRTAENPITNLPMDRLNIIAGKLARYKYELLIYQQKQRNEAYIVLVENNEPALKKSYWGLYAFKLGPVSPYIIESPYSQADLSTEEFATNLFMRLNAEALLVAGAHPFANQNKLSDIVSHENSRTFFNLVNQILWRDMDLPAKLAIQCRSINAVFGEPVPNANIVVRFIPDIDPGKESIALREELLEKIKELNTSVLIFTTPTKETAGFDVVTPQTEYLMEIKNADFVTLWISPELVEDYAKNVEGVYGNWRYSVLGISTLNESLYDFITNSTGYVDEKEIPEALVSLIEEYRSMRDDVILEKLKNEWSDYEFARLIDTITGKYYLVVKKNGAIAIIASLSSGVDAKISLPWNSISKEEVEGTEITEFSLIFFTKSGNHL